MERINSTGGVGFNKTIKGKKKKDRGKKVSGTAFASLLSSTETNASTDSTSLSSSEDLTIEEYLDRIHESGEKLKKNPTYTLIKQYKKAVSGFIQYVIRNSFFVSEEISGFSAIKRKRFLLIRVIDQKLEKLASGILQNQKDQLELLKRVEEINGLLVDLLR